MSDRGSSGPPKEEAPAPSGLQLVHGLADKEGVVEAPTDIALAETKALDLPQLTWKNYGVAPAKLVVTNTGHTVNVGGKWESNRSYLRDGPFKGQYVFAQMHFHWGPSDDTGSEHSVDGVKLPMELHVVHINRVYRTQELALKENDGVAILIYLFQLQEEDNSDLTPIVEALPLVTLPQTSTTIEPMAVEKVIVPFQKDYFLYWGAVSSATCKHRIMWLTSRTPLGISSTQLAQFRQIRDVSGQYMVKNFRETHPRTSYTLFHVNPSSKLEATLLALYPGHALAGSKRPSALPSDPEGSRRASAEDSKRASGEQPDGKIAAGGGKWKPGDGPGGGPDDRDGHHAGDDGYKSLEGTVLQESSHQDVMSLDHVESGVLADADGAPLECKESHASSICLEDAEDAALLQPGLDVYGLTLDHLSEGASGAEGVSAIRVQVDAPQEGVIGELAVGEVTVGELGLGEVAVGELGLGEVAAGDELGPAAPAGATIVTASGTRITRPPVPAGVDPAQFMATWTPPSGDGAQGGGSPAPGADPAGQLTPTDAAAGEAEPGSPDSPKTLILTPQRPGSVTTVTPSGTRIETTSSGTRIETKPSGTRIETKLPPEAQVTASGSPAAAVPATDAGVAPVAAAGYPAAQAPASGAPPPLGQVVTTTAPAAQRAPTAVPAQVTASGAPVQGTASGAPVPQLSASGYPVEQVTASGYPMPQVTSSGYPVQQVTPSGYPVPQVTASGVPVTQYSASGAPIPQSTPSAFSPDAGGPVTYTPSGNISTPAATPGAAPGAAPGATPGAAPGAVPGAAPGAAPGATPGATVQQQGTGPQTTPSGHGIAKTASGTTVPQRTPSGRVLPQVTPSGMAAGAAGPGTLQRTPSGNAVFKTASGTLIPQRTPSGKVLAQATPSRTTGTLAPQTTASGQAIAKTASGTVVPQRTPSRTAAASPSGTAAPQRTASGKLVQPSAQRTASGTGIAQVTASGTAVPHRTPSGGAGLAVTPSGTPIPQVTVSGSPLPQAAPASASGAPVDGEGGVHDGGGGQAGEYGGGGGQGGERAYGDGGGAQDSGGEFGGQGGEFGGAGGGRDGGEDGEDGDRGWADAMGDPEVKEEEDPEGMGGVKTEHADDGQPGEERQPGAQGGSTVGVKGSRGSRGSVKGSKGSRGSVKGSADGGECISEKGSKSSKVSKKDEGWADAEEDAAVEAVEQELGAAALTGPAPGEEGTHVGGVAGPAGQDGDQAGGPHAGGEAGVAPVDGAAGAAGAASAAGTTVVEGPGKQEGDQAVDGGAVDAAAAADADAAAAPDLGPGFTGLQLEPPPPPYEFKYFQPELEEQRHREPEPVFFNSIAVSPAVLHSKSSLTRFKPTMPCHGKALKIYEEEKQMWMGQAEARQAVEEEALKYMDLDEEEWDFIVNDVAQQKAVVRPPDAEISGVGWPFDPFESQDPSLPLLSPIDVNLQTVAEVKLNPLVFDGHFNTEAMTMIINTGETVEVRVLNPELMPTLHGGPLHDDYIFDSMHFHWSSGTTPDSLGSVHKVGGQRFCMEVHMLHYRAVHGNKTEALRHQGGLCAVAFMLHLTGMENPFFSRLARELSKIQTPMACTPLEHNAMLCCAEAAAPFGYITYPGTLVGREDNLNVVWVVYPTPIGVCCKNTMQFQMLRAGAEDMPGGLLATHELADRPVLRAVPA